LLFSTYCNYYQIKENEVGGACNTEVINVYNNLVGRPEAKRPIVKYTCRWGDTIKMDLREIKQ
jgi:hypothetical protein